MHICTGNAEVVTVSRFLYRGVTEIEVMALMLELSYIEYAVQR